MSADRNSSTDAVEIYIPLLNEGVAVVRPATGIPMGNDVYRVVATDNYDPGDEQWEFPPGSVVNCERQARNGEVVLVATTLAQMK